MKQCLICNRTYSDDSLRFCLEDGSILSAQYDPEATLVNRQQPVDFIGSHPPIRAVVPLTDEEMTLVQEHLPDREHTDNRFKPSSKIVFHLKCHASQNSDGWFDSPPRYISAPYPYNFMLHEPAICLLIAKMAIWRYSPDKPIRNVVEVCVDSTKVAVVGEDNNMDFLLKSRIGDLEPGRHELTFTAHYETYRGEVHAAPSAFYLAQNYFTLSWIKIIAKRSD
jgi:hypothetical protein